MQAAGGSVRRVIEGSRSAVGLPLRWGTFPSRAHCMDLRSSSLVGVVMYGFPPRLRLNKRLTLVEKNVSSSIADDDDG
jgi:hypothetical protein